MADFVNKDKQYKNIFYIITTLLFYNSLPVYILASNYGCFAGGVKVVDYSINNALIPAYIYIRVGNKQLNKFLYIAYKCLIAGVKTFS